MSDNKEEGEVQNHSNVRESRHLSDTVKPRYNLVDLPSLIPLFCSLFEALYSKILCLTKWMLFNALLCCEFLPLCLLPPDQSYPDVIFCLYCLGCGKRPYPVGVAGGLVSYRIVDKAFTTGGFEEERASATNPSTS